MGYHIGLQVTGRAETLNSVNAPGIGHRLLGLCIISSKARERLEDLSETRIPPTALSTKPAAVTLSQQLHMKANGVFTLVTLASLLLPLTLHAAPDRELLELINEYRADPPLCEGKKREPLPPLAPNPRLTQLEIDDGTELQKAVEASGYKAARAEAITLFGPPDARTAMRYAAKVNCRLLLSSRYSEVGVSQRRREWQIVLAQPLLDPNLGDWREAGREVLKLVNAARTKERKCGTTRYKPASPLRWNGKLGQAALTHSRDMAQNSYFSHKGSNGSMVGIRAKAEGYAWRSIGENVAAGQGSPQQVVEGWLASPGHCANIMNSTFTETGAAYVTNPESDMTIYWTQVFGAPR